VSLEENDWMKPQPPHLSLFSSLNLMLKLKLIRYEPELDLASEPEQE